MTSSVSRASGVGTPAWLMALSSGRGRVCVAPLYAERPGVDYMHRGTGIPMTNRQQEGRNVPDM
jgi:hypothetical protein